MEKCNTCGAEIPEGAQICPICQNGVSTHENENSGLVEGDVPAKESAKSGKMVLVFVVAAIIMAMVVGICLLCKTDTSPKGILSTCIRAINVGDEEKIVDNSMSPKELTYFRKTLGVTKNDMMDSWEENIDTLHEEYGKYRITYDIEKISESEIAGAEGTSDSSEFEISDRKTITAKVTISGDEGKSKTISMEFIALKMEGKWKIGNLGAMYSALIE